MKIFHIFVLIFIIVLLLEPSYSQAKIDESLDAINTVTMASASSPTQVSPIVWPASVSDLPGVQMPLGSETYLTMGCVACHGRIDEPYTNVAGPWLGDIVKRFSTSEQAIPSGQFIYESILEPNKQIAANCPNGPCASPSAMPLFYSETLSTDEMASIVFYLVTERN
jgi:hypothetical protein